MSAITGWASRPLTFISAPAYGAALAVDGIIVAERSRCGRYWTFRATYATTQLNELQHIVAEPDDLRAYRDAFGGDLAQAGGAVLAAWLATGVR